MKHVTPYQSQPEAVQLLSQYFTGTDHIFSNILTVENIKWEAHLIDIAESVIPEQLCFDLHFDMIIAGGSKAVTQYYKGLINGKNEILEKAKLQLGGASSRTINEAAYQFNQTIKDKFVSLLTEASADGTVNPIEFFKDKLGSLFNPAQAAQAAQVVPLNLSPEAEVDAALAGGEYSPGKDGSTFGLLKSLWDSLTEGGSAIGILHLVLDIIGIIGDFVFPGAGAIADILNACIYFYREKWILGTISLIAGVIFGAGDVLKLFKPAAKSMESVMMATAKGSRAGSEALSRVPLKERGLVVQGLRYIAKTIGGVLGTATGILGKFFDSFIAKIVGWVPFIGKPLKAFFENVGQTFVKYGDTMKNFSGGFAKVESEILVGTVKDANSALNKMYKTGGKYEVDGATKLVKITDGNGKVLGEFSQEILTDPKFWGRKAPNLFRSTREMNAYYRGIKSGNRTLGGAIATSLGKVVGKAIKNTSRLALFVGKQVIKYITDMDPAEAGYTSEEVEYWGNSALQSWIDSELKKRKEETGAVYIPALELDSSDKETFERITNYQNEYAQMFGQPTIIPVIYNKFGNEEAEDEFDEYFEYLRKEANKPKDVTPKEKETNESVSFKHIIPFYKFQ